MTRRPLEVWLYGTRIATIAEDLRGRLNLTWTDDARDRFGEGSRVLSAKLPIGSRIVPALVKNYLDGLLPEGNARTNHAMAAGVPPDDSFALARAYGRDTPGAAQLVQAGIGDPTRAGRYEPLSLDQVAARVLGADQYSPADPTGVSGESSTLPGMVPKITLHREAGTWYACKGGAASTWIVKRAWSPESGIGDVIDTEVLSLALARRIGLTDIEAEILDLDGTRAIAVSRYDRDLAGAHPRIHQEDLAQAIGLNTLDPNRKFQWGSAMPSLRHAHDTLVHDGGDPDPLLRLATFSYLVGNTDMHAKNISFMRHPHGRVALSPAYDIAMHLHHPRDNRRSALDLNAKFVLDQIEVADLVAEGHGWGLTERRARATVLATVTALVEALDREDPAAHPGVPDVAWATVRERVERALASLTPRVSTQQSPSAPVLEAPPAGATPTRRRGPRRRG